MNDQLQKIADGRVIARRDVSRGLGVSARGGSVCVHRSGGETPAPAEVACYDADTLAPRWAQPTPRSSTWGHSVAPVQSASHVYLPSNTELTAFRLDDGAPVWADRGSQDLQGRLMVTSRGLLLNRLSDRLELRAHDSGEVLKIWSGKRRSTAVSPSGRVVAFAADDGSLWLLRF
jgi:outer membrane protein assembly factor BamB